MTMDALKLFRCPHRIIQSQAVKDIFTFLVVAVVG